MLSSPHYHPTIQIHVSTHNPNSTTTLLLPFSTTTTTTRLPHLFPISSSSPNHHHHHETHQNPDTTTTTSKEIFRKHNDKSTAFLLHHLSTQQQQQQQQPKPKSQPLGSEQVHSIPEEDRVKLLEISLVRKRTPQFPGAIYIQSPSDADVSSSLPPLRSLFAGAEDEEMIFRAVEIRRTVTVEIFKEAMRKGKFGITYSTNLVSRLPEFIDFVMIKAASMKQLDEYSQSTFNVRAKTFIDESNVVPLIRWLKHNSLSYPQIGKLICMSRGNLDAVRHVADWLKSINVKGRFIGVALVKAGENILELSDEELDEIVGYLESHGVRRDWMGYVVSRCPWLLSYSMDELKSRVQFYLDMGMNDKDFGTMVFDYPQVLGYFSMEEMKQKVGYLMEFGLGNEDVGRLLAFKPQLMACSIEERWKPLVKYLYYLGISKDGMRRILTIKPMVFCVDLESTIVPKVQFLRDIGVKEDAIGNMLVKFPPLLTYSLYKKIRPVNLLSGSIPSSFASLGNLTLLDMSSNFVSGTIPPVIGTLSKLQFLNLSNNGLSSSIPAELGDLSSLVDLDLSFNSFSGSVPVDLRGLRNLQKMVIRNNLLAGSLPGILFPALTRLQFIMLNHNNFTGNLPDILWSLPELRILDASDNNFTGALPNISANASVTPAVLDLSQNMFYGLLTSVLRRFNITNLSSNYFEGRVPDYARGNASLDGNCLQNSSNQRSAAECASFYAQRGLTFDNFGLPNATQPSPAKPAQKSHKHWIILGGVLGGLVFIALLVIVVVLLIVCTRKRDVTNQRAIGVGPVPAAGTPPPPGLSLNFSSLGEMFTYQQILQATDNFNDVNLIKNGHSGDLFRGILEGGIPVVIKKIDLRSVKKEAYMLELDFFSKISHTRLVPLLGHCLENENENQKFLVYKYMPNGDLSNSLYRKTNSDDDSLQSLDWITRLKIAIGAAEGLSYLHHECNPPLVHRDVQASSILLDDKFEVRLGSLSEACAQEGDTHQSMITRLLRLPTTSEQGTSGLPTATCAYDVYCFGKVLLELVTGKLGLSASSDSNMKEWLEATLPCISIYDKELVTNILDPSLIIDEDLLEEVWAMAIVARSCLNPKPSRRPLMRYILKALENPLKVVREEHTSSARLRTTSSRGSWNAALFGSWRHSSSDVVAMSALPASKHEGASSFKQSGTSASQGSGQNGGGDQSSSTRRQSKDIFPEPSEEQDVEKPNED